MSAHYVITAVCFFPDQVEATVKALKESGSCVGVQVTELEPGDMLTKVSDVKIVLREIVDNILADDYKGN